LEILKDLNGSYFYQQARRRGIANIKSPARNVRGSSAFDVVFRALSSQSGILDWQDAVSLFGGDGNIASV